MPSFSGIVRVIVMFVVLTVASGRGEVVWKVIGEVRRVAIINAHRDWGCPSLTGGSTCTSYDPARYK